MNFLEIQVSPPRDWSTFEELSRALFAAVYGNPLAARNGRTGQEQHGVDVYLEWPANSGRWIGIQCKGKTRNYGAKATKREFDTELAKAEKFQPGLARWVFVTTSPDDAVLMEHARKTSTARSEIGKFPVEFLGWDSLLALLDQHHDVARQFYPAHFSAQNNVSRLAAASADALAAIEDTLTHGTVSLSLMRPEGWRDAKAALEGPGIARLTGEGGAGKSGILRRLAWGFDGPRLILKDNRVAAQSFAQYLVQLGIDTDPITLLDQIAGEGPALCAIDGADRMLMSESRGVVIDLLRAIAACKTRARWKIVTSARVYRERDLVADALKEAGFQNQGMAIQIGALTKADSWTLAHAFPNFARLLSRSDLGEQNRSLFLLRELLRRKVAPETEMTELDIADAWAAGDVAEPGRVARRSKALAQIGTTLVAAPWRLPGRAEIDAEGLQVLLDEGAVLQVPNRDALRLSYDVHEDWLLARHLHSGRDKLAEILEEANEPLWWLRAVRLVGQLLLEQRDYAGWRALLAQLEEADGIDPAWARAVLAAPLYSERSREILEALEPLLLQDDAQLLRRLLDTLIVFETRLNERLLAHLADRDESTRYAAAAYYKIPELRSWGAFLRWSLPRWANWPATLIPRLSEIAEIFVRATSSFANEFSEAMAKTGYDWLVEIEDARHRTSWEERRKPFGVELDAYHGWEKVEDRLRETLVEAIVSAPQTTRSYLLRLTTVDGLRNVREKLLAGPGRVPTYLPHEWVGMCLKQFLPPRQRRPRDRMFGPRLFDWFEMGSPGLRGEGRLSPASSLRAGFDQLFEADEKEALRFFHRLEMRASVAWRWYNKCEKGRRPLPVLVEFGGRKLVLWGDNPVYRWSRGILGGAVIGSIYLALDEWLERQASDGRDIGELIGLVLQNNGLVATTMPLIALLGEHVNTKGAIDHAGPFLARPRLWEYDVQRHIDDLSPTHRIDLLSGDNMHYQANERSYQRHSKRQPMHHALMLPFQIMAGPPVREAFDMARRAWTDRDLADFSNELEDPDLVAERATQIERYRSDADPAQIVFEQVEQGVKFTIAPPEEALPDIAAMETANRLLNEASALANWVGRTRDQKKLAPDIDLEEAIARAKQLSQDLDERDNPNLGVAQRIGAAAIAGTAAVAVHFLSPEAVQPHLHWAEGWLVMASFAGDREDLPEVSMLFSDHQVVGAWGLAGLTSKGLSGDRLDALTAILAVHRLNAVASATIAGLDWSVRPDFVRAVHIAALDACVIDIGWWWRGDKARAKANRRTATSRARAANSVIFGKHKMRMPALPPAPDSWKWIWTGKWPRPIERRYMPAKRMLDWNQALAVVSQIDWGKLTEQGKYHGEFSAYLRALIDWTRAYSEETDRRDRHFPYEWGFGLAKALGRFAYAHGGGDEWRSLLSFDYHDRPEDLLGEYLEGAASSLIESGKAPDDGFWAAWQPAADWLLENAVSPRFDEVNHLREGARAAGLVGPYYTPIPPDWPHLELVLGAIDKWIKVTSHQASAAYSSLQIVERMDMDQRRRWFLPWLTLWTQKAGSDESYWSYGSLGNKAAALLSPLADSDAATRRQARVALAVIADAGSTAARELISRFAGGRQS